MLTNVHMPPHICSLEGLAVRNWYPECSLPYCSAACAVLLRRLTVGAHANPTWHLDGCRRWCGRMTVVKVPSAKVSGRVGGEDDLQLEPSWRPINLNTPHPPPPHLSPPDALRSLAGIVNMFVIISERANLCSNYGKPFLPSTPPRNVPLLSHYWPFAGPLLAYYLLLAYYWPITGLLLAYYWPITGHTAHTPTNFLTRKLFKD